MLLVTLHQIGEVSFGLLGTNGLHFKTENERFTAVSFGLLGTNGLILRQRIKDLLLRARIVVRTSNMQISRRSLAL